MDDWRRAPRRLSPLVLGVISVLLVIVLLLVGGDHAGPVGMASVAHPIPTAAGSVVPTRVSAGCSIAPWDWGSCLQDAWNWVTGLPSAAAGAIQSIVVGVVLWIYTNFLAVVVSIFVSVGQTIGSMIDFAISAFAAVASLLGVFALPVLTICLVGLAAGLIVAWQALKDVPVVGGFA